MLSKGFKIASPKTFEIDIEDLELKENDALVKIEYAAICKADLRYYLGNRDSRVLGLKYPMRLIHEAVGTVLTYIDDNLECGDKVVLVPNICKCDKCDFEYLEDKALGANYCPKAKFASSNYDGFSTECISYPIKNLVKYDNNKIKDEVAVYSELISVAIAAIRRIELNENKVIGVWGDGILGYILAHVIKSMGNNKIIVVGRHLDKLEKFNVNERYVVGDKRINELNLDIAFECVGGKFSSSAINELIEAVKFGGDVVLTGVSENGAKINTRRILEKAIRITGSTRSSIDDFKKAVELLGNHEFYSKIKELNLSINLVEDISDYYKVFERESHNTELGKNIIKFNL